MKHRAAWVCGIIVCSAVVVAGARAPYPLDAFDYTGIRRLVVYRLINEGKLPGGLRFQPGATLPLDSVRLRLRGENETFVLRRDSPKDSALQAALVRIVGNRHPSYRVALLDITDAANPRFAGVREHEGYIPGSVGKLLVMTGLFHQLKEQFPFPLAARAAVLRNTWVTADDFVIPNSHQVPVVDEALTAVTHRAIRVGDRFTLWEWVDHMVSPSSNAAGSIVWKQVMLLSRFGARYPPSRDEEAAYMGETPRTDLSAEAIRVIEEPLRAAGIDTSELRQRTFFTATASRRIPGQSSLATPFGLVKWLLQVEQGQLVDPWSSLEMKRLMYFTRRRYRFAASPALNQAAVYFKSGSLYRCQPEPGYQCGQYRGNAENLMHSVAIVESPARPAAGERQRVYLISMMSNVLKVNSAAEHLEIATLLERAIRARNP